MKRKAGWVIPALVALFFLSGAAGLGYQVLWVKAFGAGIGHEYPATLAIVTAFMFGLAIGAWGFDCLPLSIQASPRVYGVLEMLIGVWGIASVALIPFFNRFIVHALGPAPSFVTHWAVVFSVTLLVLLPATSAMGATLPAIERLLARGGLVNATSSLYAANTAGAMLGALSAAFVTMPLLGIRSSILLFACCNLACGVAALYFSRYVTSVTVARSVSRPGGGLALRLFATGLLGIAFETLVIRGLSHILENTVFTLAVVLAVYLLGTSIGAALARRTFGENGLFLALAGSCLISGILLKWMPSAYLVFRTWFGDSVWGVASAEFSVAVLTLFLPAVAMGATFSTLAQQSLRSRSSLAWSVSLNASGAALAPIVFGLLLIPWCGLRYSFAIVAIGYSALAGRRGMWAGVVSLAAIPFLTGSSDLVAQRNEKIVFHRPGLMASVTVLESTNRARVLKVNNRFQMGGTSARGAEARHAHIPLLLHPSPKTALFIGLGTGITFATAADYPGVVTEGVELLPEVVEAMPFFQTDPAHLQGNNLRTHVADGRRFVLTTTNRYDVVVGDLFHPAQDGAAFLYTREHFSAIRDRLNTDGLFCQWLPLFQMDLHTFDIVAHTFRSVFPNAEVWLLRFNVDTPVAGLIGWAAQPRFASDLVEGKERDSDVLREQLRTVSLGDTLRLMGCRLGRLSETDAPINTDDRPIVLFEAPRLTFQKHDHPGARLLQLVERFTPNSDLNPEIERYSLARNAFLRGLERESRGEITEAVKLYIESARLASAFTSGYAQALGIATTLAGSKPEVAQTILRQLIDAQPDRPVARQLLDRLTK